MPQKEKVFPLNVILTAISGVGVVGSQPLSFGDFRLFLSHMVGADVYLHEMGEARELARLDLQRQFPQLCTPGAQKEIEAYRQTDQNTPEGREAAIGIYNRMEANYGSQLTVAALPKGLWDARESAVRKRLADLLGDGNYVAVVPVARPRRIDPTLN